MPRPKYRVRAAGGHRGISGTYRSHVVDVGHGDWQRSDNSVRQVRVTAASYGTSVTDTLDTPHGRCLIVDVGEGADVDALIGDEIALAAALGPVRRRELMKRWSYAVGG